MGERDSAVGSDAERGSDAGDDFERNAGGGESFHFFATAPEDERVAAFEPNDREAAARAVDHHAADFFLREGVDGFFLADVDVLAVFGSEIEQMFVGEVIVEDAVGDREELAAFPGDEAGIAGACAYQIDFGHLKDGRRRLRGWRGRRRRGADRLLRGPW